MAKSKVRASIKASVADCRIKKRNIRTRSEDSLLGSKFPAKGLPGVIAFAMSTLARVTWNYAPRGFSPLFDQ